MIDVVAFRVHDGNRVQGVLVDPDDELFVQPWKITVVKDLIDATRLLCNAEEHTV